MAANASTSLSSLLRQATLDDHEEVLRQADHVFHQAPGDLRAQHTKLVALLKLDRYQEALSVLEEAGESLKQELPLIHAYSLYKSGRLEESKQVASNEKDSSRGLRHVEAQVAYRMEDFARAMDLYGGMSANDVAFEGESSDVRINTSAVNAQLRWGGSGSTDDAIKSTNQDLEHFDLAFNAACAQIAQGNLKQAEFLLNRAKSLCEATDELSSEEKNTELITMTVQQIYVLWQLGKVDETQKLIAHLTISSIDDLSTRHIAEVNTLAGSASAQNPYLFARLLSAHKPLPLMESAFQFQTSALHQNSEALCLQTGKHRGVMESTAQFLHTVQHPSIKSELIKAGTLNAAAHGRNLGYKATLKQLQALLETRPKDIGSLLTMTQLLLSSHDHNSATALLERFFASLESSSDPKDLGVRFAPGLVALLVGLYVQTNRSALIKAELSRAAAYWRSNTAMDKTGMNQALFKEAAIALLHDSNLKEVQNSRELFEIVQDCEQSKATLAGLRASATTVPSKGANADSLASIKDLVGGANAVVLEKAGIPRYIAPAANASSAKRPAPSAPLANGTKKARHAKLNHPYDPAVQPDPERWLPLRDRSSWRPKGKKKGRLAGGMSTQGGIVSEDSRPTTPVASQVMQQARTKTKKKSKTSK